MVLAIPGSVWRHAGPARLYIAFPSSRHETEWKCAAQEIADQSRFFQESPVTSHQSFSYAATASANRPARHSRFIATAGHESPVTTSLPRSAVEFPYMTAPQELRT